MRAYGKAALVAAVLVGLSGCSDTESGPTSAEPSVMATPAATRAAPVVVSPFDTLPKLGGTPGVKPSWWAGPDFTPEAPASYTAYMAPLVEVPTRETWGRGTNDNKHAAVQLWAIAFPARAYDPENMLRDWEMVCGVLETDGPDAVPQWLRDTSAYAVAVAYTCPNLD